jgi:predicted enzyme related to lactoylglutathione lyase
MKARLWFNLLCADPQAQMDFYQALLGWPEALRSRSPIYRALEQDGIQLGFNARPAYALLNLAERQPREGEDAVPPVTAFATFMLASPQAVDAAVGRARELGARIVEPPYPTYYGQWQAVIADPEHHVFRLSCEGLPEGITAPALEGRIQAVRN